MSEQKLDERIRGWALDNGGDEDPVPTHIGVPPLFLYEWADEATALEADNTALREQIERAMEAMGLTWGDLEGFGGAVEGICDTMDTLRKRVEGLEEALEKIYQWSKAYPLSVFPEPDFDKAAELLKAGGMTLDAVSASNMRHVVEGVGEIAQEALAGESDA